MDEITKVYLIVAMFLLLGIFAGKISSLLRIPVLLMILAVGMLAGSDGLGGIYFADFTQANFIGSTALAFILFSGGYDTPWKDVRKVLLPGTLLSSLGVLLTAALLGLATTWLLGVPLEWGLLFGSVISSTDAAAVFAVFRSRGFALKGKLRPLLEYESGSNDPMAAFLTLFMISKITNPEISYGMVLPMFLLRFTVGTAVGIAVGHAAAFVFNKIRLEYDGLYYVLGVATVFLSYSAAELFRGNGFMAVYVCGLTLGNCRFVYKYGLGRFSDGIAWLMQVVVFMTLGLLIFPKKFPDVALDGVLLALLLMFVVRPLAVFICLIGRRFSWRDKLLVTWGGFRGAAPIVLATFPFMANIDQADRLFELVFFIVLISILIQGKTMLPLARLLKLDLPARERPRFPLEFEETGHTNDRLYQFTIGSHSPVTGKKISELALPAGVLIPMIGRGDSTLIPNGETTLLSDDEICLFYDPMVHPDVERLFIDNEKV